MDPTLLVAQALFPFVVGLFAYLTRSLDGTSSFAGAVMGSMIVITQGFDWFLAFLAFFIAGTAATKYKYHEKSENRVNQRKRRIENVLGNGLMALAIAFIGWVYGVPLALYGFFAALSTATADTMSSEIGVLSPKKPVSVLDFRTEVRRGTNGGVSNLGNTFMFFGAAFIGFIGMVIFHNWALFWISLWAGVFGCMVDSIVGATVENKGTVGNSAVNFIATVAGTALALVLAYFILPAMPL